MTIAFYRDEVKETANQMINFLNELTKRKYYDDWWKSWLHKAAELIRELSETGIYTGEIDEGKAIGWLRRTAWEAEDDETIPEMRNCMDYIHNKILIDEINKRRADPTSSEMVILDKGETVEIDFDDAVYVGVPKSVATIWVNR